MSDLKMAEFRTTQGHDDGKKIVAKILVVDDEPDIRKILRVHLEKNGFAVDEAESWQPALNAIVNGKPDLIILDLGLPGLSGLEISHVLKDKIRHPAPIVVFSAFSDLAENARRLGASSFVDKSKGPKVLLEEIRRILKIPSPTA